MKKSTLKSLHICSGYAKQSLYRELVISLANNDIDQFVYVPVRSKGEMNRNFVDGSQNIQICYSNILRKYHRLFFRLKIATIFTDLQKTIDVGQYAITHAHFLYSDGAVARKIHKNFGIPYIVAVRNTDINMFMKFRPDLRWVCWDILRNASQVIFLTPTYLERLIAIVPPEIRTLLVNKSKVIPNGVDELWFKSQSFSVSTARHSLRLLYVGDFSRNKNIIGAIKATEILNNEYPATLTLVGSGGDGEKFISNMLTRSSYSFVTSVGRVTDRKALRDIYASHDIFLMPSFFETFGLSYIEALSQGLPIVHAQGQGVDGYFSAGGVAEAVDPSDPRSIAQGVRALSQRLSAVKKQCIQESKKFNWKGIAKDYKDLYCNIARQ